MSRALKQLVFFLFFVIVFGSISFGLYIWLKIEPTCFDGIKNQEEKNIDCEGPCETICLESLGALTITESFLIPIEENDYDFVALVNNPNLAHGSGEVEYELRLKDSSGGTIKIVNGEFDILPGQTRYVFISPIETTAMVADAEMTIIEPNWQQLTDFGIEDIRLVVQRGDFSGIKEGNIFAKVEGVVVNKSEFDFDRIEILVILFDADDNIVAAGMTNIRTFLSDEESFYEVNWFRPIKGIVSRTEAQVTTNSFENLNFLRRYGGDEQFQVF